MKSSSSLIDLRLNSHEGKLTRRKNSEIFKMKGNRRGTRREEECHGGDVVAHFIDVAIKERGLFIVKR
jgi:hypothetical protein